MGGVTSSESRRLEYYARFLDDERLTSYYLREKFDGCLCSQNKHGMENVLVLWIGTNDLALNITNVVPQVYRNMAAMAQSAHRRLEGGGYNGDFAEQLLHQLHARQAAGQGQPPHHRAGLPA